jgi:multidrug efflux pump subunit AcrA (membrane-fusion protein)
MAAIRLAGDAGSEEASARLRQFEELEQALDTLDTARAELAGAQATLARVEQEVERLSAALGYVRATRPADAVIETFYGAA